MRVSGRHNAIAIVLTAFLTVLLFLGAVDTGTGASRCGTAPPPRIMLWAWERPEDLRFIDTKTTGVAFLAGTIKIRKRHLDTSNVRHQPLRLPASTYLMSVVRIESDGSLNEQDDKLASAIVEVVPRFLKPGVQAVQFDFDARKSERGWYRKFLTQMRRTLPKDVYLSMTSLASWCLGDDWLGRKNVPVDEVVPMFFEMGADSGSILILLQSGNTYGHSYEAIGISENETSLNRLLGKMVTSILKPVPRVYMFSRTAWKQRKVQDLIREVDSWK